MIRRKLPQWQKLLLIGMCLFLGLCVFAVAQMYKLHDAYTLYYYKEYINTEYMPRLLHSTGKWPHDLSELGPLLQQDILRSSDDERKQRLDDILILHRKNPAQIEITFQHQATVTYIFYSDGESELCQAFPED